MLKKNHTFLPGISYLKTDNKDEIKGRHAADLLLGLRILD